MLFHNIIHIHIYIPKSAIITRLQSILYIYNIYSIKIKFFAYNTRLQSLYIYI